MEDLIVQLARPASTKIVLLVMDGVGGFHDRSGPSELAAAHTPNLDALAESGSSGSHIVVGPGITPGSGAGHLALFGYDPVRFQLGRGALSGAGIGFELKPGDVAARVNFCTVDGSGAVVDRRAGRLPTDENGRLAGIIQSKVELPEGFELFVQTEKDHRALLVLRGPGLSPKIADTDPQVTGVAPLDPVALEDDGRDTSRLLQSVLDQVRAVLAGERANFILLRGFDTMRQLPGFFERYKLQAYGIAGYPMYIGIARLVGMEVAEPQISFADSVATLERVWGEADFFYVHHKATDAAGEDGDRNRKIASIEEVDALLPRILALSPDVLCVTGDHATPPQMKGHSWHPVPVVMSGALVGVDSVSSFDELSVRAGALGMLRGMDLMPLMLAAAGRLAKFGA